MTRANSPSTAFEIISNDKEVSGLVGNRFQIQKSLVGILTDRDVNV